MTTRQAYVWETRDRSGAGTFYASDDDEARGIAAGKGFGLPVRLYRAASVTRNFRSALEPVEEVC